MEFEIQAIKITSDHYPPLLKRIPQPPKILYCMGDANALFYEPAIAIVGTRRATRYGLDTARTLARDTSSAGIAVVSGLALGIDAQAHTGALEGRAPTIAVLGSGLHHIVPTTNYQLALRIMRAGGAVVSEFEPNMPAESWTFPQRNRIIAGLSGATIVVEAPEKSGALITARFALDFNRDVGAVPGEIISIHSIGTNQLLRDGAALIRSVADIAQLIGMEEAPALDNGNESDNNLLQCLDPPADAAALAASSPLPAAELMQTLTRLELAGRIKNKNGIFYRSEF